MKIVEQTFKFKGILISVCLGELCCSFQFETETEGVKLRRDVLTAGSVGLGPTSTGIASLMSGQEEMFAFRRAVSTRSLFFHLFLFINYLVSPSSKYFMWWLFIRHCHKQLYKFVYSMIRKCIYYYPCHFPLLWSRVFRTSVRCIYSAPHLQCCHFYSLLFLLIYLMVVDH